jgi:hypothetical protein
MAAGCEEHDVADYSALADQSSHNTQHPGNDSVQEVKCLFTSHSSPDEHALSEKTVFLKLCVYMHHVNAHASRHYVCRGNVAQKQKVLRMQLST